MIKLTTADAANYAIILSILGGSIGCAARVIYVKLFGNNKLPLLPPIQAQAEPTQKELTMTDVTQGTVAQQASDNSQLTAAIQLPPPVLAHPVIQQVVNQVYSDPTVAPANAPSVVAGILSGLSQAEPAILAVTRASPATAIWANLGMGLFSSLIEAFFPHPATLK